MKDPVTALGERYQQLRYAAWGRGATPLVERGLADATAAAADAYREWAMSTAALTGPASDLPQWVTRAEALAAQLRAAGRDVPAFDLPPPLAQQEASAALIFTEEKILPTLGVIAAFLWWMTSHKKG